MEFITWLNDNSGAITAGATIVLGFITWRYVHLTKRLLKATTNTPRIAIYLSQNYEHAIMMCVENIGTGPAYDVNFPNIPSFPTYPSRSLKDVGFLNGGINYLPPGHKKKSYLSSANELAELMDTTLRICVIYKDSEKKEKLRECFYLDFGEFMYTPTNRSPLNDIANTLKHWKH